MEEKRLYELKQQLARRLGMIHNFSDSEVRELFFEINKYPLEERTIPLWRELAQKITKSDYFIKGLDMTDINSLHEQIQAILSMKSK